MNDLMVMPAPEAVRARMTPSTQPYPLREYPCILRRPDDRTEINETGRPNYVIAWLRAIQRASAVTTYISLPLRVSGFIGCGHPRFDAIAGYQIIEFQGRRVQKFP